ncbi:MAG: hypothetical protein HOH04_00370 [Rhodospirillaceae bacterium]|jgi:hypothetical protein|nr:hypothetical protein [Rhodospirillaceae bacterium]
MTNRRLRIIAYITGLLVLVLIGDIRPAVAGSLGLGQASELAPEIAQSGNIMQCMEQCIRSEGSSEKATCKSRCANISSKPQKQRNCMGTYKSCKKRCAKKDKACNSACKQALMNCS